MSMKRIRRSKAKNYTAIIVLLALMLTAGYATFAQPLAYRLATVLSDNSRFGLWYGDNNGDGVGDSDGAGEGNAASFLLRNGVLGYYSTQTSTQASIKRWDVGFVNVKMVDLKGTAREKIKASFDNLSATFDVLLSNPGDSITYEFTIKNKGIIDAKLDSYDIIVNDNEAIKFDVENLVKGEALNVGKTKKIRVTTSFDSEATTTPDVTTEKIKIILRYVQK